MYQCPQITAKEIADPDTELKEAFADLADGADTVSARSLVHVMGTIGEPLPVDRLELLLSQKGLSLDANLTEAQFISLLKA